MTAHATNETTNTLRTVEFIDAWLNENAMWIDSRVVDFALDVRTLLVTEPAAPEPEREPVGADA